MVTLPLPSPAHPSPCTGLPAIQTCQALPLDLLGPQHLAAKGSVQQFQDTLSEAHLLSGITLGSEDTEISETLLLRAQRGDADRCQGGCIASTKVKSMGWLQICFLVLFV